MSGKLEGGGGGLTFISFSIHTRDIHLGADPEHFQGGMQTKFKLKGGGWGWKSPKCMARKSTFVNNIQPKAETKPP